MLNKLRSGMVIITIFSGVAIWNYNRISDYKWTMPSDWFLNKKNITGSTKGQMSNGDDNIRKLTSNELDTVKGPFHLELNMTALRNKVKNNTVCMEVAADPKSFWRSLSSYGVLNTSDADIDRMEKAFTCGMLYPEFLSTPAVTELYAFEKFYFSEPTLVNVNDISNEHNSVVSSYNSSLTFTVGDIAAFKIEMKDGTGKPKLKGGDQIRVWFQDSISNTHMAAKVTDLNNGTYLVTAPLPWAGRLRLHVALAYPREYLRAVLYILQVLKTFRPIAAVYNNSLASEATPCYQTQVVPAFGPAELCDLTKVNGAPWFCGHPIKSQLNCSHYAGSVVIGSTNNYPITDAEREILDRSCKPRIRKIPTNLELTVLPGKSEVIQNVPCHKVSPKTTWTQDIPTGYISRNIWYPLICHVPTPNYSKCFSHKKILIFGDSNGRSHYHWIQTLSKCTEIKKALTEKWHKPLMCIHQGNNFTVSWDPHTNPFMHGHFLATVDSLIPTSNAIDQVPSQGEYLIILNHFFHLTTFHISSIDFMFRFIKDALVRLFKRNQHVQVVLQGPHVSWIGWTEHYAAGDMFGTVIMDLQKEIFHDIIDRVVFISPWDMTIAVQNLDFHPSTQTNIFDIIVGFMCQR